MEKKPNYYSVRWGKGIDEVMILTPANHVGSYSALYTNQDTKAMDSRFGLVVGYRLKGEKDGRVLPNGAGIEMALNQAVGLSSLGNTNVELLMRYFVEWAKIYTCFVGLPEEELKIKIEALKDGSKNEEEDGHKNKEEGNYKLKLKSEFIEQALAHKDIIYSNKRIEQVSYLRRVTVDKVPVLFPRNLRKR